MKIPQILQIPAQFAFILGIAADAGGNIYVADANAYKVYRYTPSGAYRDSFSVGNYYLWSLTMDPAGNLYGISDDVANLTDVIKFSSTGPAHLIWQPDKTLPGATVRCILQQWGCPSLTSSSITSTFIEKIKKKRSAAFRETVRSLPSAG